MEDLKQIPPESAAPIPPAPEVGEPTDGWDLAEREYRIPPPPEVRVASGQPIPDGHYSNVATAVDGRTSLVTTDQN